MTAAREWLSGSSVIVPAGAFADLPLDTKISGANLLKLTHPLAAEVVAAGDYAFTICTQADVALTPGKTFTGQVTLRDPSGEYVLIAHNSAPSVDGLTDPATVLLPIDWPLPAGATIVVTVFNHDTIDRDFHIGSATVRKA